jgi:hypothetical protein
MIQSRAPGTRRKKEKKTSRKKQVKGKGSNARSINIERLITYKSFSLPPSSYRMAMHMMTVWFSFVPDVHLRNAMVTPNAGFVDESYFDSHFLVS